jgi:chloramphenicol-sensitive protein RarD
MLTGSPPSREGILYALGAFSFWGLVPIYFKALSHIPPFELLCHRILWSVPVAAAILFLGGQWSHLKEALGRRSVRMTLLVTSALVGANWFLFIYAVSTDRILQSSLGYYINPLVNVLLGMVFLGERLNFRQAAAVSLAAAGTIYLTRSHGELPWLALALAFTFAVYGLLRKTVQIESVAGLFVETCLISPMAIGALVILGTQGKAAWGLNDPWITLLLVMAGPITVLPLIWFTNAARRLPYSTVGILQYLSPTIMFLLSVFLYKETFTTAHLITFLCIWSGVVLYTVDAIVTYRNTRAVGCA